MTPYADDPLGGHGWKYKTVIFLPKHILVAEALEKGLCTI